MRHYIMHFWHQLPETIKIYVNEMDSLDEHMFTLLENIYLPSMHASADNVKHVNTMAELMPVWYDYTFQHSLMTNVNQWQLCFDNVHKYSHHTSLGKVKVKQCLNWKYRIQFKTQLIQMFKVNYEKRSYSKLI